MKLIRLDNKTGEAKIAIDTVDDLWHLEKILSTGDRVTAHSMRSVRIGTKEEKNTSSSQLRLKLSNFQNQ